MTREQRKISPEKVREIKGKLTRNISLRYVAQLSGVSYYTVWMVKTGRYDDNSPYLNNVFKRETIDSIRYF
jgi:hypothetical protein